MSPSPTHAPRVPFWVWCALPVLIGAWLRLRGIGIPEPFVDEGANILTALDSRVRVAFEPLAQGRPALSWLFIPAGWAPLHALALARIMSAAAGLATVGALGWMAGQLAGRRAAVLGLWLWAVLPMAVFHERLALEDPFVTALLAGAVALFTAGSSGEAQRRNWIWFLSAGGLFGLAFLLKISALLALPWIGVVYLAVQEKFERRLFDRRLGLIALGSAIPVLCLGSELIHLGGKLDRYDALPAFHSGGFFPALLERLAIWFEWYAGYGGWPLLLLTGSALVMAAMARNRPALLIATAWALSVSVGGLAYHNTFARYALTDHVPLLLFIAAAVGPAFNSAMRTALIASVISLAALTRWTTTSWKIVTDPRQARIPLQEIQQYFTGPWSGRGLNEIKTFLQSYGTQHNVNCLVLTHQFLRPGCYGMMLAELANPRIGVVPFTIYEPGELALATQVVRRVAAGTPTAYFILYEGSIYPAHPWLQAPGSGVHRALDVSRGEGESFTLYQVDP